MMRALFLNVVNDRHDIRFADGESAIPVLPREPTQVRELCMYPFGRIAFQVFGDLAGRKGRRSHNERMDMILDATDLQRGQTVLPSHAADVGPDAFFQPWFDICRAIL